MVISVETASIDLRYRHCRISHGPSEQRLLSSMATGGIRDPLLGVVQGDVPVLLDGFKRLHCAKKLGINQVDFRAIADDEAAAIIALMRQANAQSLRPLEQACLIDELRRVHKLSIMEIARRLERSTAWVSMRLGLTTALTPFITEKIMSGAFPMHAYLHSVRPLTRVNKVQVPEVEAFVHATAGKGLSVRDIDLLARGYFQGGDDFRCQVRNGDVQWCIEALRPRGEAGAAAAATDAERQVLIDLEVVQRRVKRLATTLASESHYSPAFLAEAHLLCGGLLRSIPSFSGALKDFYDRTRPQKSDCGPARQGHEQERDRPDAEYKSHHGP
jgi:hypothetical protein